MTDAIRTLPDWALIFGAVCTASVVASLVLLAVLWLLWVWGEATRANVLHDLNHPNLWDSSDRAAQEDVHTTTDPACTEHRRPETTSEREAFDAARGLSCSACLRPPASADRVPDDPEQPARKATHDAGFDEYLPREDRS